MLRGYVVCGTDFCIKGAGVDHARSVKGSLSFAFVRIIRRDQPNLKITLF